MVTTIYCCKFRAAALLSLLSIKTLSFVGFQMAYLYTVILYVCANRAEHKQAYPQKITKINTIAGQRIILHIKRPAAVTGA